MKIITLDLEYNNQKQVLSSGCIYSNFFNLQKFEENFYKNKVDYRTFKIHGLSNKFIYKYGKNKCTLQEKLNNFDFIVGFSIISDFKVLNTKNIDYLYEKEKVIDIQLIMNTFNVNMSLGSLVDKSGLLNQYKTSFPLHTSIMDSFLTYIFLEHLVNYIKIKTNEDLYSILKKLAKITRHKFKKEYWIYEDMVKDMLYLDSLFREIKNTDIDKISSKPKYKKNFKESIEIYNETFHIIGKYKNYNCNLELPSVNFSKDDFNMGFKEVTNV